MSASTAPWPASSGPASPEALFRAALDALEVTTRAMRSMLDAGALQPPAPPQKPRGANHNLSQAAKILGISWSSLKREIADGRIKVQHFRPRCDRISDAELEAYRARIEAGR